MRMERNWRGGGDQVLAMLNLAIGNQVEVSSGQSATGV